MCVWNLITNKTVFAFNGIHRALFLLTVYNVTADFLLTHCV